MRTVLKCRHEPESNQGSGTPGGRLTGQRVCPAACAHMRCMLHMHGLLHMAWQPAGALPNQICDSGATCAAYACQCWVVWQHFQGCHREIRPEYSGFVTYMIGLDDPTLVPVLLHLGSAHSTLKPYQKVCLWLLHVRRILCAPG